jgi:hypothetical protein
VFPPLCDAGVHRQSLLHLSDVTKGDFRGSAGILALLWNGGLWMYFGIGQNILPASLTHLQLVLGVFEWNPSLSQFNDCPLVRIGKWYWLSGTVRWGCSYLYMRQMKSFHNNKMVIFRPKYCSLEDPSTQPHQPQGRSSKFKGMVCSGRPAPNSLELATGTPLIPASANTAIQK